MATRSISFGEMTRRLRPDSRWRDALALLIVVAIAAGVGWLYFHDAKSRQPEPQEFPANPAFDVARRELDALPVKGWDRVQDFNRFRFGEPWSDDVNVEFGHNGCNTRDDILRRDLVDLQVRPGTCYAQSGVLHDPYTGAIIDFVRGPDTSDGGADRSRGVAGRRLVQRCARLGRPASPRLRQRSAQPAWPWPDRSTSTRLFAMPPRGCRRTRRSDVRSSHARSR